MATQANVAFDKPMRLAVRQACISSTKLSSTDDDEPDDVADEAIVDDGDEAIAGDSDEQKLTDEQAVVVKGVQVFVESIVNAVDKSAKNLTSVKSTNARAAIIAVVGARGVARTSTITGCNSILEGVSAERQVWGDWRGVQHGSLDDVRFARLETT